MTVSSLPTYLNKLKEEVGPLLGSLLQFGSDGEGGDGRGQLLHAPLLGLLARVLSPLYLLLVIVRVHSRVGQLLRL